MAKKIIYRISGLDSAIELIRPDASYELTQNGFEVWNDPRPQPTMEELKEVQKKTREFEESLNPIFLKSQLESRGL
jgi:hypothetical protein